MDEIPVVVFWFMMAIAGAKQPARFAEAVEDLPACEIEVHEFLRKPPHALLLAGGSLQVGCEVTFPKSEEH
jgi:hypothetical protein